LTCPNSGEFGYENTVELIYDKKWIAHDDDKGKLAEEAEIPSEGQQPRAGRGVISPTSMQPSLKH
jgi:hypothetical protein